MEQLPSRRLASWQKAMELAVHVFGLSRDPAVIREPFIRDQMARAATSIAANLAEGHGRGTARDFAAYVDRARGTLFEHYTLLEMDPRTSPYTIPSVEAAIHKILELNALLIALRNSMRAQGRAQNNQ
jgi:four helix bundle protein